MNRLRTTTSLGLVAGAMAAWALLGAEPGARAAAVGVRAPDVTAEAWINSGPRTLAELRGRVVLVEFWTFGCFNCRNVEPHVKDWHRRYGERGLVVIGVHSPEFAAERNVDEVRRYVREHEIGYAVAVDNAFATWKRYGNDAWPALYLVDKQGAIRRVHIGEGEYAETARAIEQLLAEN